MQNAEQIICVNPCNLWLTSAPGTAALTYTFHGAPSSSNLTVSATLPFTVLEPKVDITMTNDYSFFLAPMRTKHFDGTSGKKWVVATFPEPQQTNIVFDVRLVGPKTGTAKLKYQRGNGAETAIPWSGGSHTLEFVNGWLNASIRLNDGPDPTPTMTIASGMLTIPVFMWGIHGLASQ